MRLKHFLSVFLTLLTLSVGHVWGAKDDVVYKYGGSKLSTSNSYGSYSNTNISSAQTSTVSSASWAVTCGSNQNAGLWLGANSGGVSKMILSTGSLNEANAIASAISTQQTAVTTSSTYYAALIGRTNFANVYKVNLTYTTPGGTAPSEAWILYSTDNGTTWNVGEKKTSLSSGTDFSLGSTIASARYAFVIHCSGYCQFKVPILTFYEGATGPSCDGINPTLSYTSTDLSIGDDSSNPILDKDGSSGSVTWTSSNTNVATVNTSGVVHAVGTGSTTITATIAAAGGKCSGSATATINVTRPITYYIGSTEYHVGGVDGNALLSTLPTSPTSCKTTEYPYFYGWVTSPISGTATSAPTIVSSGNVSSTTAEDTYYAVFTDKDPASGSGWNAASSITKGDVVVLCNQACTYELNGISSTTTKYGLLLAVSNTTPTGAYSLTVDDGSSAGTYSFKHGSNYLSWSSGNSLTESSTKDANSSWTVSISNGVATIRNVSDNTRYLQYNSSNSRFACYLTSSGQANGSLYKYTAASANYMTTCCTELGSINGSFF